MPLTAHCNLVLFGHRLIKFPQRFEFLAGVESRALDVRLRAFRTRQEEEAVDHARQFAILLKTRPEDMLVLGQRSRSAERHFGLTYEGIDRGAQFMRQIYRKLGETGKGVLQTCEHGVEGRREGGQLRGPADWTDAFMKFGRRN